MKIAIINPWYISKDSIGGTERFVKDLAISLKKLNHEVDVYMFSGNTYQENNINYISLDLFGKNEIADEYKIAEMFGSFEKEESYKKIAKILEEKINGYNYDFLHLNSPYFLLAWRNFKRVFTHHSNYEELRILFSEKEYKTMIKLIKKESGNKKTKFVCPSLFYKEKWEEITNENTIYIPHAIDKNRLEIDLSLEEICKKYFIEKEKITILLPNRLELIQKRPMLFLEGCALLSKKEKARIQIILTGIDDQYKKNIKPLAIFANQNNLKVHFIKFDSINEGYKIADIVAIPSKSESFGYSALEGLTLGIKTILTDIPTLKEIAKGNFNAVFFDGRKEDLKEKISKLINDNLERNLPSPEWQKRYDIELFGKRYLEVLNYE